MSLAIRRASTIQGAARGGAPTPGSRPDGSLDHIAKLVPAEALGAYIALVAIADGVDSERWLFAFFILGIAVAVFALWASARNGGDDVPLWQWPLRALAFVAYALSMSEPLAVFVGKLDSRGPQAAIIVLTVVAAGLGVRNQSRSADTPIV